MAKDRITGLMFTNMDGSEKRRLILVGKSQRPRCFPKDINKLPVDYYNSANGDNNAADENDLADVPTWMLRHLKLLSM